MRIFPKSLAEFMPEFFCAGDFAFVKESLESLSKKDAERARRGYAKVYKEVFEADPKADKMYRTYSARRVANLRLFSFIRRIRENSRG